MSISSSDPDKLGINIMFRQELIHFLVVLFTHLPVLRSGRLWARILLFERIVRMKDPWRLPEYLRDVFGCGYNVIIQICLFGLAVHWVDCCDDTAILYPVMGLHQQ